MMDQQYAHLSALDDPARPWRRVYRCPATGVFVKVHARPIPVEFGRSAWRITASECDAHGKAATHEGAPAVAAPHVLTVQSDAIEPVAEVLRREIGFQIALVERAAINRAAAANVFAAL